jgi:hypothetical protein
VATSSEDDGGARPIDAAGKVRIWISVLLACAKNLSQHANGIGFEAQLTAALQGRAVARMDRVIGPNGDRMSGSVATNGVRQP